MPGNLDEHGLADILGQLEVLAVMIDHSQIVFTHFFFRAPVPARTRFREDPEVRADPVYPLRQAAAAGDPQLRGDGSDDLDPRPHAVDPAAQHHVRGGREARFGQLELLGRAHDLAMAFSFVEGRDPQDEGTRNRHPRIIPAATG
jgi:hypothetical protein